MAGNLVLTVGFAVFAAGAFLIFRSRGWWFGGSPGSVASKGRGAGEDDAGSGQVAAIRPNAATGITGPVRRSTGRGPAGRVGGRLGHRRIAVAAPGSGTFPPRVAACAAGVDSGPGRG